MEGLLILGLVVVGLLVLDALAVTVGADSRPDLGDVERVSLRT